MEQIRKHIVIVDDNPVNLELAESVLREEYKITKLISGEQLLKFLMRVRPHMVLLDVRMPGMSGFEVLSEIRKNPIMNDLPVIFITGQGDAISEREGLHIGAQDFIVKPFDNEVLLTRIRAQLELYQYRTDLEQAVREKTQQVERLHFTMTLIWAEMVESRDGTTGSHVRNTTRYMENFLNILSNKSKFSAQLPRDMLSDLTQAATVHDIGKISISDDVLKKPGSLTAEEMKDMQRHSALGADIIDKIIQNTDSEDLFLTYASEMARFHHERWDGTGYPQGLCGAEIPIYVRALSIADVYDALTSVRPYKRAFTHDEAITIIKQENGKFFDPELVEIFLEHQELFRSILAEKLK